MRLVKDDADEPRAGNLEQLGGLLEPLGAEPDIHHCLLDIRPSQSSGERVDHWLSKQRSEGVESLPFYGQVWGYSIYGVIDCRWPRF